VSDNAVTILYKCIIDGFSQVKTGCNFPQANIHPIPLSFLLVNVTNEQ